MTYSKNLILVNDESVAKTLDTAEASPAILLTNAGLGAGTPIPIEVRVGTQAWTGGTSLKVDLQTATDEAFTSPVTFPLVPATLTAALTAGKSLYKGFIPGEGMLAYVRLLFTPVGDYVNGKIFAAIPVARQPA